MKIKTGKMKGDAGLFILAFMVLVSLLSMIGVYWYTTNQISKVKVNVDLIVRADDRGSWILTFLKSGDGEINLAEALGGMKAENHKEVWGKYIRKAPGNFRFSAENIIEKWAGAGDRQRSFVIKNILNDLGKLSSASENYEIDLPAPGGDRLNLEVKEGK